MSDGGFVVTWENTTDEDNSEAVYAQKFDSNGNKIGNEFMVNTYSQDGQDYPEVTSLTNGGFVITWSSEGQDGSNLGIFGKIFDANGNPITSDLAITTSEDSLFSGSVQASDVDIEFGDTLTYHTVGIVPAGLTLDSTGNYTLDTTLEAYQSIPEGESEIVSFFWYAQDSEGETTTSQTVNILVTGTDDKPTLTVDSTITYNDDSTRTISFEAIDVDGELVTTATVSEEEGSVEVVGDKVIFTPADGFFGDANVTITTTDEYGYSVSDSTTVTIAMENLAPYTNTTFTEDAQEDTTFNGSVVAIDPNQDNLTYSLVGEAPTGLTFNSDGSYTLDTSLELFQSLTNGYSTEVSFNWKASDPEGLTTATQTATITVTGTNDAPVAYSGTSTSYIDGSNIEGVLPGAMIDNILDYDVNVSNLASTIYSNTENYNITSNITIPTETLATQASSMFGLFSVYEVVFNVMDPIEDALRNINDEILSTFDTNGTLLHTSNASSYSDVNDAIVDYLVTVKQGFFSDDSILGDNLTDLSATLITLYNPSDVNAFLAELESLANNYVYGHITSVSADLFTMQATLTNTIVDAYGLELPDLTFAQYQTMTEEEVNAYLAAQDAFEANKVTFNNSLISVAQKLVDPNYDISDKLDLAVEILENMVTIFGIDIDTLVDGNVPEDISTVMESLLTAISSLDSNTILDSIDLSSSISNAISTIINEISLSSSEINSLVSAKQTLIETQINTILANAIQNGTEISVENLQTTFTTIFTDLSDEISTLVNNSYSQINSALSNINLSETISATVTTLVENTISQYMTALFETQSMSGFVQTMGLTDAELIILQEYVSTFFTETASQTTVDISLSLNTDQNGIFEQVLEAVGLEVFASETTIDTFVNELSSDLAVRFASDVDIADIANLSFELDDSVSVITTVSNLFGTTRTIEGSVVTVNSNGTYTVSNAAFANLDSSESVQVTFNYKISDGITTSNSQTATLNGFYNSNSSYVNPIAIYTTLSDTTIEGKRTLLLDADIEHLNYVGNTTLSIIVPDNSVDGTLSLSFGNYTLAPQYNAEEQGYIFDVTSYEEIEALLENTITVNGLTDSVDLIAEIEISIDNENYYAKSVAGDNILTATENDDDINPLDSTFMINALGGDDDIAYNDYLEEIEGGDGVDRLILDDSDTTDIVDGEQVIDLAAILYNTEVNNIEVLNSDLDSNHILTNLSLDDFLSITDDNRILKIEADENDTVELDSTVWQVASAEDTRVSEEGFTTYTSTEDKYVQLLIDDTTTTNLI